MKTFTTLLFFITFNSFAKIELNLQDYVGFYTTENDEQKTFYWSIDKDGSLYGGPWSPRGHWVSEISLPIGEDRPEVSFANSIWRLVSFPAGLLVIQKEKADPNIEGWAVIDFKKVPAPPSVDLNHQNSIVETIRGEWTFKGLKVGGNAIWAKTWNQSMLEREMSKEGAGDQLPFPKELMQAFYSLNFSKLYQLEDDQKRQLQYSLHLSEKKILIHIRELKNADWSELEVTPHRYLHKRFQKEWLRLDVHNVESDGISLPIELYFSLKSA